MTKEEEPTLLGPLDQLHRGRGWRRKRRKHRQIHNKQRRTTIMLRRKMILMMIGSTPMHMTLLFMKMTEDSFKFSSIYLFPFSFPPLMCIYGLWSIESWIICGLWTVLFFSFS
ncbi:hypothetical protein AMTRI_Chr10g4090 [Amborella trichopoda]